MLTIKPSVKHVPWFQEPLRANQAWMLIQDLARNTWRDYERVILPWDPDCNMWLLYSLSTTTDRVLQVLEELDEDIVLTTTSLSSIPVLEAFEKASSKARDKVAQLVLLHPAERPVEDLARMDWVRNRWKQDLKPIEYYLEWKPEIVFDKLIGKKWKWDWQGFQNDLIRLHENPIDLVARLEWLNKQYTLIKSRNDMVTNDWSTFVPEDITFRNVLESHVPDLTNQWFIY